MTLEDLNKNRLYATSSADRGELYLEIYPCLNTGTSTCKSAAELGAYMFFTTFGYQNLDVNNFDKPFQTLIQTDSSVNINVQQTKEYQISYEETELITNSEQSISGSKEPITRF